MQTQVTLPGPIALTQDYGGVTEGFLGQLLVDPATRTWLRGSKSSG